MGGCEQGGASTAPPVLAGAEPLGELGAGGSGCPDELQTPPVTISALPL